MEHFHIVQALCRAALSNPSDAVLRQIDRLKSALEKEGSQKESKALSSIITNANKICDMAPSRIQKSSAILGGEELTVNTPLPVDKETSIPLAELVFPNQLPKEAPLLNPNVKIAVDSILNEWQHFDQLNDIEAKPSVSCLIYGAPGTGKTHLALWIANQLNIPVVLARLDGLMSSFLGTTSKNIGNLFAFAGKYRCLLLLDEFDAIAKLRNDPQEVGEIKRVVNSLLQNLDSRKNKGFTIGITNHETLLDPAIWRRFEVQIEIPKPSLEVMSALLNKFLLPLTFEEADIKFIAWVVENGSGDDAAAVSKWLKKAYVLDSGVDLVSLVRRYALLNSGRISSAKRSILEIGDEEILSSLLSDTTYGFKQKDVAVLLGKTPSTISKHLSKVKQ